MSDVSMAAREERLWLWLPAVASGWRRRWDCESCGTCPGPLIGDLETLIRCLAADELAEIGWAILCERPSLVVGCAPGTGSGTSKRSDPDFGEIISTGV